MDNVFKATIEEYILLTKWDSFRNQDVVLPKEIAVAIDLEVSNHEFTYYMMEILSKYYSKKIFFQKIRDILNDDMYYKCVKDLKFIKWFE